MRERERMMMMRDRENAMRAVEMARMGGGGGGGGGGMGGGGWGGGGGWEVEGGLEWEVVDGGEAGGGLLEGMGATMGEGGEGVWVGVATGWALKAEGLLEVMVVGAGGAWGAADGEVGAWRGSLTGDLSRGRDIEILAASICDGGARFR